MNNSCDECGRLRDDIDLLKKDGLCGKCALDHPNYNNLTGEVETVQFCGLVIVFFDYGITSEIAAAFTSDAAYNKSLGTLETACKNARGKITESVIELDEITFDDLESVKDLLDFKIWEDLRYLVIQNYKNVYEKASNALIASGERLIEFDALNTPCKQSEATSIIADKYIQKRFNLEYIVSMSNWHIEDILNVDTSLSMAEACHVLDELKANFDSCVGVNWDVISDTITCLDLNNREVIKK